MKKFLLKVALTLFAVPMAATADAQYIYTFAGTGGTNGYSGDGGAATNCIMFSPSDIAFDASGNLYIADFLNNVIRRVDTSGIITTVAGTGFGAGSAGGSGGYTGDGGAATAAELNGPFGLAIDAAGSIIFADGYSHVVRKVTTAGTISTIAGTHLVAGYAGDGGQATAAQLNNPVGIAIDRAGNIYIADDHNNAIRKINTAGIISTVAGNTIAGRTGDGGPATAAELKLPIGVALDTSGNLFIADAHNNVIRKVNSLGIISTFAGTGTSGYTGDGGPAATATLDSPERIAFDDANNLYISDYYNNVVRMVQAGTGIITTIAGNGTGAGSGGATGAYDGDDGPATAASVYLPHGVAFDRAHRMYICDRGNNVIRRVGPQTNHTGTGSLTGAKNAALTVYPNPTHRGAITINLTGNINEPLDITVTNVLGAVMQHINTMTNIQTTIQMNVPAGVYFIAATTAGGSWNAKLVVE